MTLTTKFILLIFLEKGETFFILVNMGASTQLWKMDISKRIFSQITNGKHSLTNWDYNLKSNLHVFGINTIENPGDLYLYGKTQKKVTSHYDYLKKNSICQLKRLLHGLEKMEFRVEGYFIFTT